MYFERRITGFLKGQDVRCEKRKRSKITPCFLAPATRRMKLLFIEMETHIRGASFCCFSFFGGGERCVALTVHF